MKKTTIKIKTFPQNIEQELQKHIGHKITFATLGNFGQIKCHTCNKLLADNLELATESK